MKKNTKNKIAILGGMGPDASARLYQLLVDYSRMHFGARDNHQYPEIIIYSIPVPDFISRQENKLIAEKMLIERVKELDFLHPSHICIACNTVHVLLDKLQQYTSAQFISIPHEVINHILCQGYSKVCLLATPSTIKYQIYQSLFIESGINFCYPDKEQLMTLSQLITQIVQGKTKGVAEQLRHLADNIRQDSDAIVLGCTELPLVFPTRYPIPVIDSTKILAEALLTRYYNNKGDI